MILIRILQLLSIHKTNLLSLRLFSVSVNYYKALEKLSIPVDQWDITLVYILSQNLDLNTRHPYEFERGLSTQPTLCENLL